LRRGSIASVVIVFFQHREPIEKNDAAASMSRL
jgi:hypothetical protein